MSTIPAALQGRWDVPGRRRAVLNMLGELPLRALATTEYAFADADRAYAAIDRGATGVLHVRLRYE